jgi:ubiquinone/menaquinone biosynthesis C-methylase UbiE
MKPTERFSGLAKLYASARPSYPAEAIEFIIEHCRLAPGASMIDIGCGTGISTRLFAERGLAVTGIEPNDDMRSTAIAHDEDNAGSTQYRHSRPRYLKGTAEDTGLEDACADSVLSAQAFHWFDAASALAEFHRILKPGGFAILMWNERDENADLFTRGYGDLLRMTPETKAVEMKRGSAGLPLLTSPLFQKREKNIFTNWQEMDEAGLLDRAFSASYAPKSGEAQKNLEAGLKKLFHRHQHDGLVTLVYETSVFTGQKRTADHNVD